MKKLLISVIWVLFFSISFGTEYPLKFVDSYNREIIIERKPEKIISGTPNVTEIIFKLGLDDKLIGRTKFCNYPKETDNIESIGGMMDPNLEKIIDLKPDIVFVSTHFSKKSVEKLQNLGINIVAIYGEQKFSGLYDIINQIGLITDYENEAKELNESIKDRVRKLKAEVDYSKKTKIYYVISYGRYGDYTAGGNTYINDIIEIAGGENIAKDLNGWKYSIENIIAKNPDIILCSKYFGAKEGLENSKPYNELRAIKNGYLYEIDNNRLDRQSPRLISALEEIQIIIQGYKDEN